MNKSSRKISLFVFFGDLLHINLSFFISYHLKFESFELMDSYVSLLFMFNFSWILVSLFFKLYKFSRVSQLEKIILDFIKANFLHLLVMTSFLFSMKASNFSREHLMYTYIFSFILVIIWRLFSSFLLKNYRRLGYNFQNVIIIGNGVRVSELHDFFISNQNHGFKLKSIFYEKQIDFNIDSVPIRKIEEINQYCTENHIDEIYCCDNINEDKLRELISFTDKNMMRFRVVPEFNVSISRKLKIDFYGSLPVITLRSEPLQDELNRYMKRLFDIFFSICVIVLIFPIIFPIISVIIKLTSSGPIFFKQLRSGINNKEFFCYKFRTMNVNLYSDEKQATKKDPRITSFGRFLRTSNLDEFPQFINVLFGDMSVVGPRPHMIKHTNQYSKIIDNYMVRHLVNPGITGAAQVYGFRGETKTPKQMEGRIKLDIWYIENWSLLLDFKIIVLTIVNMIKGEKMAY